MGDVEPRPRRPRRRQRARAPLELRAVAVHRRQDRRDACDDPAHRGGGARSLRARRHRRAGADQGRRDESRVELARDDQPGREARRVGARAGRDLRLRRRAVRAAPPARRAGAWGRLRRDLRAQDVRPERRRRALGPRRAPPEDGAVPDRRPHDQLGSARQDDLGRAAAQVRGRHGADGGSRRLRRSHRLPERRRLRGDRGARARARRVRARPAGRGAGHHAVRAARGAPRRHRLVQHRGHPSARRRADPRHARRCDPRGPPLLPAADAEARRRGELADGLHTVRKVFA